MSSTEMLDIQLYGKEYRVACPPEEREALLETVRFLDARLRDVAAKTHASGEKLAVMTALNVAHEFFVFQRSGGFDMPGLKSRIETMNNRIETALHQDASL